MSVRDCTEVSYRAPPADELMQSADHPLRDVGVAMRSIPLGVQGPLRNPR